MVPGDFSGEGVILGDFCQYPRFFGDLVFQVVTNFHAHPSTLTPKIVFLMCLFTRGYLDKGTLVDDHRAIARRYIKSWFVPDLVVTAIDLVSW